MADRCSASLLALVSLCALLSACAPKESGACTGTLGGAPVRWSVDPAFTRYRWTNPPCGPRSIGSCPRNIIRSASVYFTVSSTRVVGIDVVSPQDIVDVTDAAPHSVEASGAMLSTSPLMRDAVIESFNLGMSEPPLAGGGHWTDAQPLTRIAFTTSRWDANTWDGALELTYGGDRVQCSFSIERER